MLPSDHGRPAWDPNPWGSAPPAAATAGTDPLGRPDYLHKRIADELAGPRHRAGCTFGDGFYRVIYRDAGLAGYGQQRTRQVHTEGDVRILKSLLGNAIERIQRDACLDGSNAVSDANTPDVLDGERFLAMPKREAMEALGVSTEAEYAKAYNAISDAVYTRDNRAVQGGVRATIVVQKKTSDRKRIRRIAGMHVNPGLL